MSALSDVELRARIEKELTAITNVADTTIHNHPMTLVRKEVNSRMGRAALDQFLVFLAGVREKLEK